VIPFINPLEATRNRAKTAEKLHVIVTLAEIESQSRTGCPTDCFVDLSNKLPSNIGTFLVLIPAGVFLETSARYSGFASFPR
jgi:hypothetical protein